MVRRNIYGFNRDGDTAPSVPARTARGKKNMKDPVMTVYFAREQTLFLPSDDHLSRRVGADVRLTRDGDRTGGFVRSALARLREMFRRRVVLRELSGLSDRELADIGLARAELHRVFDPAFVPSRRGA